MKKLIQRSTILLATLALAWLATPRGALAYPVPPLPADNLITNPWFRSFSLSGDAGLDGWTAPLQDGIGWGISQKESNPSPDIVIGGVCGHQEVYCGTGARWAEETVKQDRSLYPDLDVYIFQVVRSEASNRKLKFFTYFVHHRLEVMEFTIYGGDTQNGPWTEVWRPLYVSQDWNFSQAEAPGRGGNPWFDTGFLETVIDRGYPYYKVEAHADYPPETTAAGAVGVKITGVYFATAFSDAPADVVQQTVIFNPTPSAENGGNRPREGRGSTATPEPPPTEQPEATAAAELAPPASATIAPELPVLSPTPTERVEREEPVELPPGPSPAYPISIVLLIGGVVFLIVYGLRNIQ